MALRRHLANASAMDTSKRAGEVDTSRPFSSVKQAVAVFDERFLASDVYSPKAEATRKLGASPRPSPSPASSPSFSSLSQINQEREAMLENTLRRLESEFEDTKREVAFLKEREAEMEAAVAVLRAELQQHMSSLAKAEATSERTVTTKTRILRSDAGALAYYDKEMESEVSTSFEYSLTLAQLLSAGAVDNSLSSMNKRAPQKKEKPIMPLITDMFSRKKSAAAASSADHRSVYSSCYSGVHF